MPLRVHKSALKHGCSIEDISHAYDMSLHDQYIDPDNDPPKILIIGPNHVGNLLELIGGELAGAIDLIWHAMPCTAHYLTLLPNSGGEL